MQDEHKTEHEADIDKTLAAISNASPPEGLDARIRQRLQYHASEPSTPATWLRGRSWWSGMLAGAALATVVCCASFLGLRSRAVPYTAVAPPPPSAITTVPASLPEKSCSSLTLEPAVQPRSEPRRAPLLIHASVDVLRPDTLTPQEQKLVHLVQVADPQQLAGMSSEARAQRDAQENAAFTAYFTPPPPPPHDLGENE